MTERAPAMIHHKDWRPSGFDKIIARAAINVDLTKNQTKLLTYYGRCAEGFRPAAQTIENETGIKSNKISETRQALSNKGLIDFKAYERLTVNWQRIETFAALTEPIHQTNRDRRANRESKANPYRPPKQEPTKKIRELEEYNLCTPLVKAELTPAQIKELRYYEGLTEAEFAELFPALPKRQQETPTEDFDLCFEIAKYIAAQEGMTLPEWID